MLAIADELTEDGFVLRYRTEETDDGMSGKEGSFLICSFWLVSGLTIVGEQQRARDLMEKLLRVASPLGLYAEEFDTSTGRHLGNFPQAFSHLALIEAAGRIIVAERLAEISGECGTAQPGAAPSASCTTLRVRYGECDPQGIVFNANYLLYFDVAFTELWRAALGPWQEMVDRGVDAVVADASISFRAPARFDDELQLRAQPTRLGTTSITTQIDVLREQALLVSGTLRHVCVARTPGRRPTCRAGSATACGRSPPTRPSASAISARCTATGPHRGGRPNARAPADSTRRRAWAYDMCSDWTIRRTGGRLCGWRRLVWENEDDGQGSELHGRDRAPARRSPALSKREVRAAIHAEAGLYVLGGLLCSTALLIPHVRAPEAVAAVASSRCSSPRACSLPPSANGAAWSWRSSADLWGVVLIAVLCASAGGASSPFALIYLFAIGHAAGFQPRGRYIVVSIASLVAFLLPLTYEHVPAIFGAVALVGIVLAVMTTGVIHLALNSVREHRRRLKFLIDATASFDTSLDPAEALRNLARAAVPELAELCVIDLLGRDGAIATTVAAALDADVAIGVENLRRREPLDLAGSHPVARALATGEPVVVEDLTDEGELARAAQSDEHQRFMRSAGYRSAAVFPMVARGRTHGAISFLHVGSEAHYGHEVLVVLEDLAGRAAMAFDNARLYAERTHVAQTLRRSLMPSVLPADPRAAAGELLSPAGRRQRSRR